MLEQQFQGGIKVWMCGRLFFCSQYVVFGGGIILDI